MAETTANNIMSPNATQFELDVISVVVNKVRQLYVDIRALSVSKSNTPAAPLLPYIVREYGFHEVSKFIPDNDSFMSEGISWKKDRGTPAAVNRAISWFFREDNLIENSPWWHWTNVELRIVNDLPSFDLIKDLVYVVRKSLPARSHLSRVWSGDDLPCLILNEAELNNCRLNVPGGIWNEELQLWLYLNKKDSYLLESTYSELSTFTSINTTTYLRKYPKMGDYLLNEVPSDGLLVTIDTPIKTNNHITFNPVPLRAENFIVWDDTYGPMETMYDQLLTYTSII